MHYFFWISLSFFVIYVFSCISLFLDHFAIFSITKYPNYLGWVCVVGSSPFLCLSTHILFPGLFFKIKLNWGFCFMGF